MSTETSYAEILKDHNQLKRTAPSPYGVHSLTLIMESGWYGQRRTDRSVTNAENALISSLWRLANLRPSHLDVGVDPKSEENDDINGIAPLAASVAYDAAALHTALEGTFPNDYRAIRAAYFKLVDGLLLGEREPISLPLLLLGRELQAERDREDRESAD